MDFGNLSFGPVGIVLIVVNGFSVVRFALLVIIVNTIFTLYLKIRQ
jgi:hypothetical protein